VANAVVSANELGTAPMSVPAGAKQFKLAAPVTIASPAADVNSPKTAVDAIRAQLTALGLTT
jgi:hypothetical protein